MTGGSPGGAFDFRVKTSVSGQKQRVSQFFDSARAPRSQVIALVPGLVDSIGFSVVVVLYNYIVEYAFVYGIRKYEKLSIAVFLLNM